MPDLAANLPDWTAAAMIAGGAALLLFVAIKIFRRAPARPTEAAEWAEVMAQRDAYRASEPAPAARTEPGTDRTLIDRADAKIAALQRLLHQAESTIARLEALGQAAPPRTPAPRTAPRPSEPPGDWLDDAARTVYRLADEGHDAATIAQLTNSPRGHVELMLAIRRD